MPSHLAQMDLPYTAEQVFDLVADFESYPQFLPHVLHAHILRRRDDTLFCEQVFRVGPMKFHFHTQTQLDRPRSIHVVCADSPFGTFDDRWHFDARSNGGTHVTCRTVYHVKAGPLRVLVDKVLDEIFSSTMHAFERQARRLYSAHAGAAHAPGLTACSEKDSGSHG